jgi:hypothetical protein
MDSQNSSSVQLHAFEYHVHEYDSLRAEILARQEERAQIETWGAAGIFAIYAWLCSEPSAAWVKPIQIVSWWIPFLAALYCYVRIRNISEGIKQAGAYLIRLQSRLADKELGGWETSLGKARAESESSSRRKVDLISKPMKDMWFLATLAALLAALAATILAR